MNKQNITLICIIFLAAALRFWDLGKVPGSTTNDEVAIIYSAYSIAKTGRDVAGNFLPISIRLDESFSPVYAYITAPFVKVFGISLFSGRLPFAIMGTIGIFIMYKLVKILTKDEYVSLISAFILAVSPWHIQLSRVAYDAPTAFFFFLWGLYVFLSNLKTNKVLWSIPLFFLGFYSYHATKVFLIAEFFILLWVAKNQILKKRKSIYIFIALMLTLFTTFMIFSKSMGVTRQSVFLWTHTDDATRFVNMERNNNLAPVWLMPVFNNKLLYYLRIMRENFLEAFSTNFLFLYGETAGFSDIVSVHFRGTFYIIEAFFLLFGLLFIARKIPQNTFFILSSLIAGALPSTVTADRSIIMRDIMMLPFYVIIMSFGLNEIIQYSKKFTKPVFYGIITFIIIWYIFLIFGYLYQYYYRFSVYGAEAWFRSHRDLSEYIIKNQSSFDNIYVAKTGFMFLLQYGTYGKIDPVIIQKAFASQWPKKIGKLTLINDCIDTHGLAFKPDEYLPPNTLYIVPPECYPHESSPETITQVGQQQRIIWKIYKSKKIIN